MKVVLIKGDFITITVSSHLGVPPMLVARINFIDREGKEYIYSTDDGWLCNGKTPKVFTRFTGNRSKIIANWIYAEDHLKDGEEVSCSFQIPC